MSLNGEQLAQCNMVTRVETRVEQLELATVFNNNYLSKVNDNARLKYAFLFFLHPAVYGEPMHSQCIFSEKYTEQFPCGFEGHQLNNSLQDYIDSKYKQKIKST